MRLHRGQRSQQHRQLDRPRSPTSGPVNRRFDGRGDDGRDAEPRTCVTVLIAVRTFPKTSTEILDRRERVSVTTGRKSLREPRQFDEPGLLGVAAWKFKRQSPDKDAKRAYIDP